MISAGADFIAAEALKFGAEPLYFFSILPFFYDNGIGAGQGTFVNVSFVAPGRLQVDEGAGYASWISAVLQARGESFPITIIPTWLLDYPGYDCVVEFRTAAALAAFVDEFNSQYPPAQSGDYVKATSVYSGAAEPYMATDPALTLTGAWSNNVWLAGSGITTEQRFHIDLGSAKIIKRIYYENAHTLGSLTNCGAKNFTLYGSNDPDAFADLDYSHDTGWTQIPTSQSYFNEHAAGDAADPQYITLTNAVAYRYYAFKVADNWGGAYLGLRRIELQEHIGEEWSPLVENTPISLYRYYQWRISWVAIRAWAFDTEEEAEADGGSAWALDENVPGDSYLSYAVDTAFAGTITYIENVRFRGLYELPLDDVKDPGICIDECSTDIGEPVAGDHTLVLLNRDSIYSPLHDNFVLGDQANWKKRTIRIEAAYKLLNGQITSRIILYEGTLQNWGPTPYRVDESGKMEEHTVSIRSRDVMADLMEQKIGKPDDDGKPNPLVFGSVFRQAEQLADETLGDPDGEADFEGGDTTGLAGVDSGSGGEVAVGSAEPLDGNYYLHTGIANAGAYAKGRMDLAVAGSEVLFTATVRFTSIPENPIDKNMHFMGLFNNAGNEILQLFIGSDYRVQAYANGEWKETEWYINRDVGVPKTVSIGVSGVTAGTLKAWLAGDEILTWDGDWSGLGIKGGFIGPHNGGAAEAWVIDSDSWKIYPNWWPQLYRVWGGAYEAIGAVYVDGAIKVGTGPAYPVQARRRLRYASPGLALSFVGGTVKSAGIEKYPDYGAVAFTDYANQVSGTVMVNLTKNNVSHPVDVVKEILTAAGKEAIINDESFDSAKAARPDDSIYAFFENCTVGDAIKAVAATCLLDVYRSQNQIKIRAYSGAPPTVFDLDLDESELIGTDPTIETAIKNQVFAKWGWYQRNPRLSYTAKDADSIADEGIFDTEIDLSHGGMVGSDNGAMARQNADRLLSRLLGGMFSLEETNASLRLARLEPGDAVRLNVPYLGAPVIMHVAKKTVKLGTPKGVSLKLVKFLGEIAA